LRLINKIIVYIFIIFLLIGCSNKENFKKYSYELKKISSLDFKKREQLKEIDSIFKIEEFYYLIDRISKNIYIFTQQGTFLKKIGGKGKGPGEFMSLQPYGWGFKKVVFFDLKMMRLSVYNSEGKLLKIINLENEGMILAAKKSIIFHKKNQIILPCFFKKLNDSNLVIYDLKNEKVVKKLYSEKFNFDKSHKELLMKMKNVSIVNSELMFTYIFHNRIKIYNMKKDQVIKTLKVKQLFKYESNEDDFFKRAENQFLGESYLYNNHILINSKNENKNGVFVFDKNFNELGFIKNLDIDFQYNGNLYSKKGNKIFKITNIKRIDENE